jgi:hypothetical protein
LIEAALSLEAKTDTLALFGNYGLTDRWDVAAVVPFVHVSLDARVQATILRLATASQPLIHTFEAGNPLATQKTFEENRSARGIGDVLLRTKYRFLSMPGGGLAGALDIRLPTGDQENLLGAGSQVKVLLVASGGNDRLSPHVNIGYAFSNGEVGTAGLLAELGGAESLPDEFNYTAGMEWAAHPKVTIVGDVVGRTLRNAGRLDLIAKTFEYQGATAPQTAQFEEFDLRGGNLNLVLGAVGFKINPARTFLISGNVLFPLSSAGLQSKITTVFGIDYAF